MANTSVKRLRMDDFEMKGKDVLELFLRYRDMRESLELKGNSDEPETEPTEELNVSNVPRSGIHGLGDEEKSDVENALCKEICKSQKSKNIASGSDFIMHKCTHKGCSKSFKNTTLLALHTQSHTSEELKKSFPGKPEETQPETKESQECSPEKSYDVENIVSDDEESDAKSSVFRERCNIQNLKPESDTSELKNDCSDDVNYEDEGSTSNDEEQNTGSSVSKVDQKSQKLNIVKASSGRKLSVHVCPYEDCDKFFSRPFRLAQHIRTHTGERPYVCPSESCSKSYTRQQHLKRHIEVSHQGKEMKEDLKCEVCGLMLSNVYCLRKHVLRQHVTKKHECSECGQTFAKQQQLQKHTYEHTGIKPFSCDYPDCEIRCLTVSALKRHKLTHQKSRYTCPQESCQQKFDTYKDLQHHFTADHPKVCDICSRPFRQLRSLRKHRLTHENTVNAYFCPYPACNRHYTQVNNLTAHIKQKHEHLKIYECGTCEKQLSSKQKLMLHMSTHIPSYKRNYSSKKPRKPRKDKGCIRLDYARVLSGYDGPEEGEGISQGLQSGIIDEGSIDANTCPNRFPNPQSKVLTGAENESNDSEVEAEEM